MKKKIVSIALVAALAITALVGTTLAYFTDTDDATNTFTVGNVSIDLIEEFDAENAELMPGKTNAINKDVWVENDGNNPAWVRVKIYIPSALDQLTTPQYTAEGYLVAAAFNTLHMNTVGENDAIWNVSKANVEAKAIEEGEYAGYNEYIFYYNEELAAGDTTEQLLDQVYLDSKVDCDVKEDGTVEYYVMKNGEKTVVDLSNLNILVVAEAIQSEGFGSMTEAWAAFEAQN